MLRTYRPSDLARLIRRIPKYHPGWFATGAGGGLSTVAVTACLTGNGTAASPLDVAGWPLSGWVINAPIPNQRFFAPVANTVRAISFWLPAPVVFSFIGFDVGVADAVNNCDVGIYDSTGALVAHIGAQPMPTTGVVGFGVVGAPITLSPGLYFYATTSDAATATIFEGQSTGNSWCWSHLVNAGASAGGALPASITPLTRAPDSYSPDIMLS
jgi:hypothetical protein